MVVLSVAYVWVFLFVLLLLNVVTHVIYCSPNAVRYGGYCCCDVAVWLSLCMSR